ncbi:hypothetical protein IAR50_006123 [Cryptococcus sp. DSM 104548]
MQEKNASAFFKDTYTPQTTSVPPPAPRQKQSTEEPHMTAEVKGMGTISDIGAGEAEHAEKELVAATARKDANNFTSDTNSASPSTLTISPLDESLTNSDISFQPLSSSPSFPEDDSLTSTGEPAPNRSLKDGDRAGLSGGTSAKEGGDEESEVVAVESSMRWGTREVGGAAEPEKSAEDDSKTAYTPSQHLVATNYTYDTPQEAWLYTRTDASLSRFRERFHAKRDITTGRIIMWERPLILYDCQNAADRYLQFHSQLSHRSQDKIQNLPDNYPKLGGYGRWFGNSVLCDKPIRGRMFGLFERVMRVPRSCVPNAHFVWDEERCAGYIIAAEDISRDTEISIRWDPIYVYDQSHTRRIALKDLGHTCTCPKCSLPPHELAQDDAQLERYYQLTRASQASRLTLHDSTNTSPQAALDNFTRLHDAHLLAISQNLPTEQEKLIENMTLYCVKCGDLENAQAWLALQRDVVLVSRGEPLARHMDLDRAVTGDMLKKDSQWGTLGEIKLSGPRDDAKQASAEPTYSSQRERS